MSLSSEIVLTGLRGSHPLGFLGALGVLRNCSEDSTLPQPARLQWIQKGDWLPVLSFAESVGLDQIFNTLQTGLERSASSRLMQWEEDLKIPVLEFRKFADDAMHEQEVQLLSFLAALVSDAVPESAHAKGSPSPFYMLSGPQKLFKEMRKILQTLLNPDRKLTTREMIEEATMGPWRYADEVHTLGWDPSSERLHAYLAKAPGKTNLGVYGAVWLGFEGLPPLPSGS